LKAEPRTGTVILWSSETERLAIETKLVRLGYTFDGRGLLQFIKDKLAEKPAPPPENVAANLGEFVAESLLKYAKENPQSLHKAKNLFGKLFK